MSDYREFQGKNLDAAIRDACDHFGVPREKLDIDIVSDAKGGIFGLVGARKATIRARLVRLGNIMDEIGGKDASSDGKKAPRKEEPEAGRGKARGNKKESAPAGRENTPQERPAANDAGGADASKSRNRRGKPRAAENAAAAAPAVPAVPEERPSSSLSPAAEKKNDARNGARKTGKPQPKAPSGPQKSPQESGKSPFADDDENGEDAPRAPLSSLDEALVIETAREVICRLVEPMLGECEPAVRIEGENLRVAIEAADDPGLLIGREGQNLAAVQYLATRMLTNKLQCRIKLHLDAGDYRQRQDDRLRELAAALADKARASGKPQLTRPLSSYQRRVIHVTLQDDEEIQTHSKGDGDMKRVVIAPRKK